MSDIVSKICPRCQLAKPLSDFWTNRARSSGYDSHCKECKKLPPLRRVEVYPDGYKKCTKCKVIKLFSEFYPYHGKKGNKYHLTAWCIECSKANANERMSKRTYEQRRSVDMHWRYGITRDEYTKLHNKQRGVCAMCKRPETKIQYGRVMELGVDHNHITGQIRGLLCADCNRAIGMLREDIARIKSLLAYLQQENRPLTGCLFGEIKPTKMSKAKCRKYGITVEIYNALFQTQNGTCAICKMPETATLHGSVKYLAIDHCHKTGRVRGLLCMACNRALGLLSDNPKIIKDTLKYLQKWNKPISS